MHPRALFSTHSPPHTHTQTTTLRPRLRPALKSAPASPPLSPAPSSPPSGLPPLASARSAPGTPGAGRPLSSLLSAVTGLEAVHRAPAAAALRALQGARGMVGPPPRVLAITCAECADAAAAALAAAGLDPATTTIVTSTGAVADEPALVAAATAFAAGRADAVFILAHAPCAAAAAALATWVAGGGRKLARPPPPPRRAEAGVPAAEAVGRHDGRGRRRARGRGRGRAVAGSSRGGGPRHDVDGAPVSLATAVDAVAVGLVEAEWKEVRASPRAAAARRGGVAPALHDFATPSLTRMARVRAVQAALAASARARGRDGGSDGDAVAPLGSDVPPGCTAAAVADEAGRLSVEAVLKGAARTACVGCGPDGLKRGSGGGGDAADGDGDDARGGAGAASRLVVAALRLPEGGVGPATLLRAGWCDVVGTRRCYYFEGG